MLPDSRYLKLSSCKFFFFLLLLNLYTLDRRIKPVSLKCSDLVHWEDLEGSGGEGGGREDRDGEHM